MISQQVDIMQCGSVYTHRSLGDNWGSLKSRCSSIYGITIMAYK